MTSVLFKNSECDLYLVHFITVKEILTHTLYINHHSYVAILKSMVQQLAKQYHSGIRMTNH